MKTHAKQLSFKGQNIYVGIDVHLRQWTVTIRTQHVSFRSFSMNPSPQELAAHLQKHYPEARYYSVYEAGFSGFWIHRELVKLGIHNIIVNPADVPTTHKEKVQKRDKRDSKKLARGLADGTLVPIYIPSCEHEALRAIGRRLLQVTKSMQRVKTRIKHFLHTQGVSLPKNSEVSHWSARFVAWLKSLSFDNENKDYYLNDLIAELEFFKKRKLQLFRHIRRLIKDNETIKNLRTVSGVGITTAFTFYTEIMDIGRFPQLDQLVSYIGLVPAVKASDEKEHILGLCSRGNKYLRYLIIEAAWVATQNDPAMTIAFEKQLKNKPKQKAIIRIAKKLVNRMRYVWKNKTEYVTAVAE